VARLAGIEGDVTLRILIGEDGTVRDLRPVLGPPVLARAAMRAVEQWRYAPALVDGRPVDVVTTVTFAFHLR
jgi:protein TonB